MGGTAVPAFGAAHRGVQGVNVDAILLDQPRMQAITGAGQHLTIIPTMDGTSPVDIDALADNTPRNAGSSSPRRRRSGPMCKSSTRPLFKTLPTAR